MRPSLAHALGMLALAAASLAAADARVAALGGAVALAFLLFHEGGDASRGGVFGGANLVTAGRVLLLVAFSASDGLGPREAGAIGLFLALDGLDGWLARRTATATPIGARFDMETDALFVLVAGLRLCIEGRLGGFVVVPGLLRYAYAGALAALPVGRGDAPRSLVGRSAFAVLTTSFAASAWPAPGHTGLAIVATLLVTLSFANSAWYTWGPRPHGSEPGPDAPLRAGAGRRGMRT